MTLGELLLTDFVLEQVTVKENEDIEKGEFIVNDGAGWLAATAALASVSNVYVAREDHDYSEESTHTIMAVAHGVTVAQKKTGGAVKKGQRLAISATAGECQAFAVADVTATVNETTVEAANLANLNRFGECIEDAESADTEIKVRL
jgi:hypothetical protein